jgi:hypothetical protein
MKMTGAALTAAANNNGIKRINAKRFIAKNSDDHYIAASRVIRLTFSFRWSLVPCHWCEIRYIDSCENTIANA